MVTQHASAGVSTTEKEARAPTQETSTERVSLSLKVWGCAVYLAVLVVWFSFPGCDPISPDVLSISRERLFNWFPRVKQPKTLPNHKSCGSLSRRISWEYALAECVHRRFLLLQ